MRKLTDVEKKEIWEEVKKEFPRDEMMQEIHYIRMAHTILTDELTLEERIKFYNNQAPIRNIF